MDAEHEPKMPDANTLRALSRVKKPRKPRPSEIAAKKVRRKAAKAKRKPAKKKVKKPVKNKSKARKVVKTKRKPSKPKVVPSAIVRTHRVDLRLTKAEKEKLAARAKKTRRTITSIVSELIEKMK